MTTFVLERVQETDITTGALIVDENEKPVMRWQVIPGAESTPSPSVDNPLEHLHYADDNKLVVTGAEVFAHSAESAIIRAEDLLRAYHRFNEGEKDEIVLRWYDRSGNIILQEEVLANTDIARIMDTCSMPHEIGVKHMYGGAIHALRYRRIDNKTRAAP